MPVKVIVNASFTRQIAAFRGAEVAISTKSIRGLVGTAAVAAQQLAKANLKELVYTADLPASAYRSWPSHPEKYLEKRRLGTIFRAIDVIPATLEGDTWTAATRVKKDDFPSYYYALILNYGGKKIDYKPRPFWSRMVATMKVRYAAAGRAAIKEMNMQIRARMV